VIVSKAIGVSSGLFLEFSGCPVQTNLILRDARKERAP
jgi:hypothetical protein